MVLAVDLRKMTPAAVVAALQARGIEASLSPVFDDAVRVGGRLAVGRLPAELRDAVWPMDDGSQLVARALDVKPGEHVLDLCAGGGGKSRFLASRGAKVVAVDVNERRLTRGHSEGIAVIADGRSAPFAKHSFDRVLVDAPCSGTGTLRRAPDLAHRLDVDDVPKLRVLQGELLDSALSLVKPGGLVVYGTCSLLPQENHDVVEAALKRNPTFTRVPLSTLWGADAHVVDATSEVTLLPSTHGTDGFYVAALRAPA
jgi:16S rRNA (cytosine967-C5)-methyltransferase